MNKNVFLLGAALVLAASGLHAAEEAEKKAIVE